MLYKNIEISPNKNSEVYSTFDLHNHYSYLNLLFSQAYVLHRLTNQAPRKGEKHSKQMVN